MRTYDDDMVIRPQMTAGTFAAQEEAAENRRIAGGRRKRGAFSKLRQAIQRRKALRKAALAKRELHRFRMLRKGARFAGRAASWGSKVASPLGLAMVAFVTGTVVMAKIQSGKSIENLGQELNNAFLGDLDDEARAKLKVKKHFQNDRSLSLIAGRNGFTPGLQMLASSLMQMHLRDEKAASLFRSDKRFQYESWVDILIRRIDEFLGNYPNTPGGKKNMEKFKNALEYRFRHHGMN